MSDLLWSFMVIFKEPSAELIDEFARMLSIEWTKVNGVKRD